MIVCDICGISREGDYTDNVICSKCISEEDAEKTGEDTYIIPMIRGALDNMIRRQGMELSKDEYLSQAKLIDLIKTELDIIKKTVLSKMHSSKSS